MRVLCRPKVRRLREQLANRACPAEACALLGGRRTADGFTVSRIVAAGAPRRGGRPGAAADRSGRAEGFELPSELPCAGGDRLQAAGLTACGVSHGQPDGRPVLSRADRVGAFREHVQLIGGVAAGSGFRIAAFAFVAATGRPLERAEPNAGTRSVAGDRAGAR